MKIWTERPKEEAHLLNPAFCCITLASAIRGYMGARNEGLPVPIVFMVLPIVLHKPTRDALPHNIRTSMAAWLQEKSAMRVMFYERLISLKPHTIEAIQYGMLFDWLLPKEGGLLETSLKDSTINQAIAKSSDEARDCIMRARFVGKWFAAVGTTYTAMAFWGIRP